MKIISAGRTNFGTSNTNYKCNKYNIYPSYKLSNQSDSMVSFGGAFNLRPNLHKYKTIPKGMIKALYEKKLISEKSIIKLAENFPERVSQDDLNYLISNRVRLTHFDTPEILNNRKKIFDTKPVNIFDPKMAEEKKRVVMLESAILDTKPAEKKMIIITGLPASGKSTLVRDLDLESNFYIADGDIIKQDFKEFQNRVEDYHKLHEASKNVLQRYLLPSALMKSKNIAVTTTGMYEYVERLAKAAKKFGYTIEVKHINVSAEDCVKRNISRFHETKKFLDPFLVYKRKKAIYKLPSELKKSDLLNSVAFYTNTEEGPKLINIIAKRPKKYPMLTYGEIH